MKARSWFDKICKKCPHYRTCRTRRKKLYIKLTCPKFKRGYEQIKQDQIIIKENKILNQIKNKQKPDQDQIDYNSFSDDKDINESIKDEALYDVFCN